MNNRKPVIEILTDFDGTMTEVPGGRLVFGRFYQSLLLDPRAGYQSQLLPREKILQIMKHVFIEQAIDTEKRDPRRLSEAALRFLNYAVNHEQMGICIISKNQVDYIKAVLSFEGLTDEQIDRITIIAPAEKYTVACLYLKSKSPQQIYIYDDVIEDAKAMQMAASQCCKDVHLVNELPGHFDWDTELEMIKKKLQLNPNPILMSLFSTTQTVMPTTCDGTTQLHESQKPSVSSV